MCVCVVVYCILFSLTLGNTGWFQVSTWEKINKTETELPVSHKREGAAKEWVQDIRGIYPLGLAQRFFPQKRKKDGMGNPTPWNQKDPKSMFTDKWVIIIEQKPMNFPCETEA